AFGVFEGAEDAHFQMDGDSFHTAGSLRGTPHKRNDRIVLRRFRARSRWGATTGRHRAGGGGRTAQGGLRGLLAAFSAGFRRRLRKRRRQCPCSAIVGDKAAFALPHQGWTMPVWKQHW